MVGEGKGWQWRKQGREPFIFNSQSVDEGVRGRTRGLCWPSWRATSAATAAGGMFTLMWLQNKPLRHRGNLQDGNKMLAPTNSLSGSSDAWQPPRVKEKHPFSLMVLFSPPFPVSPLPQLGHTFRDDCSNSKFIGLWSLCPFVAADEVSISCRFCGNFVEVFVKTETRRLSLNLIFAFCNF